MDGSARYLFSGWRGGGVDEQGALNRVGQNKVTFPIQSRGSDDHSRLWSP